MDLRKVKKLIELAQEAGLAGLKSVVVTNHAHFNGCC